MFSRAFASRFDVVAAAPPSPAPAPPREEIEGWRAWLCAMISVACPCGGTS